MRRWWAINLLGWTLLLAACVTVNVYFPSVAAKKAADNIIDNVLQPSQSKDASPGSGNSGGGNNATPPEHTPTTGSQSSWRWHSPAGQMLATAGDFFLTPAAAAAQLDISSPAIEHLTQSLKSRFPQLKPALGSGAVGLTNDGLLAVRDLSAAALSQRTALRELVAAQNEDLRALYQEIARANGHPEWASKIQQTFARRWVAKAPAGWYYQGKDGGWHKK